jgi:hypothetical protein
MEIVIIFLHDIAVGTRRFEEFGSLVEELVHVVDLFP